MVSCFRYGSPAPRPLWLMNRFTSMWFIRYRHLLKRAGRKHRRSIVSHGASLMPDAQDVTLSISESEAPVRDLARYCLTSLSLLQ